MKQEWPQFPSSRPALKGVLSVKKLTLLLALLVLTLYPLFSLLAETVTIHAGREARAAEGTAGALSLYHFKRMFYCGICRIM